MARGSKTGTASLTPLIGDFTLEEPDIELDDSDEKRKKTISKSKQWKEFVAYARQRQELYREYMPGVNPTILDVSDANWKTATCIIKEYDALINFIEGNNG